MDTFLRIILVQNQIIVPLIINITRLCNFIYWKLFEPGPLDHLKS